eukprot:scaffold258426_cov30-Tisochrysis_lutea.AAC.1
MNTSCAGLEPIIYSTCSARTDRRSSPLTIIQSPAASFVPRQSPPPCQNIFWHSRLPKMSAHWQRWGHVASCVWKIVPFDFRMQLHGGASGEI